MKLACLTLSLALFAAGISAQSRDAAAWTAHLSNEYGTTSGLTYLTASNVELKLDIYAPRRRTTPNSVVIYYHGGGWAGGSRENAVLRLMPYLEMGFTVVNVTYRGARVALAPAAVEDCRCALLWVVANAERYKFDVRKIVLTGDSAGSHLALTSGMLTPAAGLDRQCPSAPVRPADAETVEPRVAAIVSWFGATDVGDLLEGPNAQGFAISWMGSQPNRAEIARRVSPLTYVRAGLPAILTIHGEADRVVPFSHATRLHEELTKHGITNQLIAVPGGGHGDFTREQNEANFAAIRAFLGKLRLLPSKE
ncbi:MAG TPA: alpha/beta hydrolase [Thermoanaerobaculia bacterium]|nr:alpha/beta hydrolase [Thermoanaerobaculia bacterium]